MPGNRLLDEKTGERGCVDEFESGCIKTARSAREIYVDRDW